MYFQILNKVDLILVCNQRRFNLDITTLTHRKVAYKRTNSTQEF